MFCCPAALGNVNKADRANGTPTTEMPGVGRFGNAAGYTTTATAILDGWHLLVARHTVTVDGSVTGVVRPAHAFRFEAGGVTYQGQQVFADFAGDLAVVRLDGAVPVAYTLWSSSHGSEVGQTFRAVGFGYADTDSDGRWGPGGQGTKRLFANRIDEVATGGLLGQGTVLRYDFDLYTGDPVGDLEGLAGPGDSGGGAFIHDGTQWRLAGLISSSGDPVDQARGSLVRIADYEQDIAAVVSQPAATSLLALAGLPLLRKRRRCS
jgi:hypothetical protein